jgi:hypothetical protein
VVAMGGLLIAGNGVASRRTSRIDHPPEPVHSLWSSSRRMFT